MFSRYKKTETRAAAPVPTGPAEKPLIEQTPPTQKASPLVPKASAPAQAESAKERQRRERLSDIRVELHKRLLDTLNLAALEYASESDLRTEIAAICADGLQEMGVVLNKDERQNLHQELFDEVTGLGPLEPFCVTIRFRIFWLTVRNRSLWNVPVNWPCHRSYSKTKSI